MSFPRRERQDLEVNLTPLIDVVFLLLIFFMVSTTFTRESHMAIDLPEATPEASATEKASIEISISSTGEYAINQVGLVNARLDTLVNALQKVSGGNSDRPLVISADANTPHQAVVTAMDAAGQLGFSALRISTKNIVED